MVEAGPDGGAPPSLAEPVDACPLDPDSSELPALAVTCVRVDPLSKSTVAVAAVVETEPVAVVWDGETLADACPETGPTVAVVEAETVAGSVCVVAVAEADAAGVLAPTVAVVADDPFDGSVCVVAVAETDAAGVLTSTVAVAAGAGAVVPDAATEALGVVGVPGSPSACAGSA